MPALNITAVANGTDQITIVGHGFTTGDGPAAVFVGSGGVIPTGLAPTTDYWLIRVDADHLKLASSSANALLGTAINITSDGTLPLQLQVGLPYRVPRTAVPGSQVKSADFNDTWAALVAFYDFLTGQAQSVLSSIVLAANQHVVVSGTGAHKRGTRVRHIPIGLGFQVSGAAMTINTTDDAMTTSNVNNVWRIPIALDEGERITLVQGRVQMNNAGSTSRMKVYKDDLTGSTPSRSQLGSTATSAGTTNVLETLSSGALTELASNGAVQYFAEYDLTALSGSASNLFGILVTTDIP